VSQIPISIDTRHAKVAEAAVNAGADIVNDVSGGTFDPDMFSTVARLRVPIVLMHMRGIPETMQSFVKDYSGKGVVEDVIEALNERCDAAEAAGIPRWMQIVDPGIGFAKDLAGNLSLLRHLNRLRANMRMGSSTPVLLGTSRKGFLGKLAGVTKPEERDYATVASCVAALCLGGNDVNSGCNIIRVHNVKAMKEAVLVMDAIRRAK
jgi:dihydropteroate synthase